MIPGHYGALALEILGDPEHWPTQDWNAALFAEVCRRAPAALEMLFSIAPVSFHGAGSNGRPRSFDIDPDGGQAFLIPSFSEHGDLLDLMACDPHDATLCATWGESWCVGAAGLALLGGQDGALRVHSNIWAWFAAGGDGLLIADYTEAAHAIRAIGSPRLVVASEQERQRLERCLFEAVRVPEISVMREAA